MSEQNQPPQRPMTWDELLQEMLKWKSLAVEMNQAITELLKEKYGNRERSELEVQVKARSMGL